MTVESIDGKCLPDILGAMGNFPVKKKTRHSLTQYILFALRLALFWFFLRKVDVW